ncbi:uncharacterized protein LOC116424229 isoform X2 [Nomia melanderi]|uniref:uncharacterized protein LOC116424229 isoform X2 n=1 Tax=Nomia melanderi TaxID=2448451 RepID=UPI003FCCB649
MSVMTRVSMELRKMDDRFPHVAKKSYHYSFTAPPTAHQSWKTGRHGLAARVVETLGREKGSSIPSLRPGTVATHDDAAPSPHRTDLFTIVFSAGRSWKLITILDIVIQAKHCLKIMLNTSNTKL